VSTRRASRVTAGFTPSSSLSAEGKHFTATHPALYLHVWCNFEGVHTEAHVDHLDSSGRLRRVEVARAVWKPPTVSERLVVEWGERALRAWLEATLDHEQE
jgi:hypothetical protein